MRDTILKVLVGSRAHGLADEKSDTDFRGVFYVPTDELLSIGPATKTTHWIEGDVDDTSWEVGHFLFMATKCNPTILEVFAAPVAETDDWGMKLRDLLPYVWTPSAVRDAFIGYGLNQRKKFLENKDGRRVKYAVAYLRVLYQAYVLLKTGRLVVDITNSPVYKTLLRWRAGDFETGEVVQLTEDWGLRVREKCAEGPASRLQLQNLDMVNEYLISFRKAHWSSS